MNTRKIFGTLVLAATIAACDSGDITLAPTNIDNSNQGNTTTGGAGPTNPCAVYEVAGQTFQGTQNTDGDCVYNSSFVSDSRPITVAEIIFPNFGGLHIFEDSLFIGEDVNEAAAQAGVRIPQQGEGTILRIAAGNTMVFRSADSYVRIARGSQIIADGRSDAPITFTADEDAILGVGTESDRGLWGGIQINGNGITNKCHDGTATGNLQDAGIPSQFLPQPNGNPHNCHATAEGRPATYGGANNAENSGVLRYVVIKHAGFEVVDGDELNALTLNGVGSGTTIEFVQTYTSLDDGFEMFGGAVNLKNIVAVNVGDDSIDYSEGYQGDIQYAVVVHTSGGNRCIEGDNTGGNRDDGITPTTLLRISNLTCVTSNIDEDAGTNPSSKGDSEGPLFREGAYFEMYNSIVTSNAAGAASNECFELADSEGPETVDAAEAGTSIAISNVIACGEATKFSCFDPEDDDVCNENAAFDIDAWLASGSTNADNFADETNIPWTLITGVPGSRGYLTEATIMDGTGAMVTVPLYDVEGNVGGIFETPTYLGGASAADDWLAGWTVGLSDPLNP